MFPRDPRLVQRTIEEYPITVAYAVLAIWVTLIILILEAWSS